MIAASNAAVSGGLAAVPGGLATCFTKALEAPNALGELVQLGTSWLTIPAFALLTSTVALHGGG